MLADVRRRRAYQSSKRQISLAKKAIVINPLHFNWTAAFRIQNSTSPHAGFKNLPCVERTLSMAQLALFVFDFFLSASRRAT